MKIPNISCEIEIFCAVNPSEDIHKIKKAILNIFPHLAITTENFPISAHSSDLKFFEKIYETIHTKKSQKTYRRNLEKNLENDTTWFYLNKQAAFANKIAICEKTDESPLGPIKIIFTSSNIDGIIDWLVA